MKKITLLFITFFTFFGYAQTKSTGVMNLNANMTAKIDLDQTTSIVTLTITNLASSWFGLGFSATTTVPGNGMPANVDAVVMRSATNFSDSMTTGPANPTVDPIQNWTVTSNTVSGTIRTLIATRPFNTGDANDYVFNYNSTSLNLIYASPGSGNFTVQYHGGSPNRGHFIASLTTLGVEDFSLNASQIYPNPSNGEFLIKTKTSLEKVNVYTQTGAFVKTIDVKDSSDTVELNIGGLQTGIYLIELTNATSKSWKKVIVK